MRGTNNMQDMEGLINQAFAHIDNLAPHVMEGRYDLIGPDKEIIMPNYWESTVEPDMQITMMLWPIPEPKPEELIPPPPDILDPDAILNLDDLMNPPKKKGSAIPDIVSQSSTLTRVSGTKKKKPSGGLAGWMMGGTSGSSKRPLKGDKKPDVAARSQHGATDQGACTVM
jgi:hypothetical protein